MELSPRDSQESSPTPHIKSINSSALSFSVSESKVTHLAALIPKIFLKTIPQTVGEFRVLDHTPLILFALYLYNEK